MPIKATFVGDVTDLRRGTQQARDEFRKVGTEAEGAARKLKAAGSSFDGTKIEGAANRAITGIQKIGGVTRLTTQELTQFERKIQAAIDKFRVMGTEVPPAIQKVARDIAHIRAVEEDLARSTERTTAALKAQAQQAHQTFQLQAQQQARVSQIGQAFAGGLGVGIGAGAGVGAAAAIGGTLKAQLVDVVRLGDEYARISKGFTVLQGGADKAEESLDRLRGATRGMVTDTNLMLAANQASVLKLNQLGVATEDVAFVATRLGAALGRDATTSINDMTTALARGSFEILDNLGISLKLSEAYAAFAPRIGKTADQLTDLEKKQAFATIAMERGREVVAKLGTDTLTAGQQVERLETAWENLKASIGAGATAGGAASDFLGGIADAAHDVVTEVNEAKRVLADIRAALPGGAQTGFTAADAGRAFARGLFANIVEPNRAMIATLRQQLGHAQTLGLADITLPGLKGEPPPTLASFAPNALRTTFTPAELEQAQRVVDRQLDATEKQNDRINRLAEERRKALAKLTGKDIVGDAVTLAQQLEQVGTANVLPSSMPALVEQLTIARTRASELGPEFAGAVAQIDGKLRDLVSSPAYRDFFQRSLRNPDIGVNRGLENPAFTRTGIAGAIIPDLNPFPRATIAGAFDTFDAAARRNSIAGIAVDFQKGLPAVRNWRIEVQGVAQAFAQLAQVGGRSLDPLTRSIGIVVNSMNAADELVTSIGRSFNKAFDLSKSTAGQLGSTALSAGISGWQVGQGAGLSPWRAAGAGALTGAGQGAMYGGAGFAVGAIVGATSAYFGAQKAESELRKQKDLQMQQLVAQYGSLDALLEAVGRLGLNQQTFLQRYYGEPKEFAKGVTDLSNALTREASEATKLGKALESVSRAQGVLSRQQMMAMRNVRPGTPGAEAIVEFAAQQRQQGEQGIIGAASALAQMASLTQEELEALTAGITDAAERQRVIDAELRRRAADTMNRFGSAAQATASGLFVAFTEAVNQGENALDVLRRLAPSIQNIQQLYQRAGLTPGAGFQQLQVQSAIATGPQTGPALQLAQGLGQALAAYANTGLLSPELFGELANGIGQAYKQLELLGQGGLEAARLMQPSLQAIWQMVQDNPALRNQLDGTTLSLLEFAEQAGLIGEAFRPAIDQMIDALNDLIAKLDEFINRIGQIPGMPPLETPDEPGAPGPGAPTPGTPGTPSNPNPPPNGGDYTTPTSALNFGGASPQNVVPLSRGGAASAPLQITVISQIDGYEAARAITRRQPDVYRTYGAA
jgi:hypothetical protein